MNVRKYPFENIRRSGKLKVYYQVIRLIFNSRVGTTNLSMLLNNCLKKSNQRFRLKGHPRLKLLNLKLMHLL
jgi:hypothetical protein